MCAKSLQSCWTLCDTVDCSPPGSSIHGILQARILQWVAVPSYRGSSLLREGTCILYVGSLPLVPPGKPIHMCVCVDFILGGSKITLYGDCSHAIKRRLFLGRKTMTNLDSIIKNRDITLPTKVCLVKGTVFPVVMYGCENWTIKKAKSQRIGAFQL